MNINRGDVLVQERIAGMYVRYLVLDSEPDREGWIDVFDLDDPAPVAEKYAIRARNLDQYKNLGPIGEMIP